MNAVSVIFLFVLVSGAVFTFTGTNKQQPEVNTPVVQENSTVVVDSLLNEVERLKKDSAALSQKAEEQRLKQLAEKQIKPVIKASDETSKKDTIKAIASESPVISKPSTPSEIKKSEPAVTDKPKESPIPTSEKRMESIYVVKQGNTFYSIARENGMTVQELKDLNGMSGTDVKIGDRLRVYSSVQQIKSGASGSTSSESPDKKKQEKVEYIIYKVQPNNTLFSIAKMHGMTVDELKALNNIGSDNKVSYGMPLKVRKPVNPIKQE